MRQCQEGLQPVPLRFSVLLDIVPAFGTTQYRSNGDQQDFFQQVIPVSFYPRILQLSKIFEGIFHIPLSPFYPPVAYSNLYASALRSVWAYLLFGYITAMLANVLLPHVPATLAFGQYTLGVASAVLINLPVMSVLLFRAVREQCVSGLNAIAAALMVPLAIAGAIVALFTAMTPFSR